MEENLEQATDNKESGKNHTKYLEKIKDKLNENKVKLWLPPFYSDVKGTNMEELKALCHSYCSEMTIPFPDCLDCLQILQAKALNKLKERMNSQNHEIAILKAKITHRQSENKNLRVRVKLTDTGDVLKESLSQEINIPKDRLKVIFQGKIIKNEENLILQGLKSGAPILVIVMENNLQTSTSEKHLKMMNSTKADVKLLSEENEEYFQITNQSGRLLNLPDEEKKKLILAMTLHEKGRVAMKSEDFSLALILLLEAEKEFSNCNPDILRNVDNSGVLNLDIVWCYLNLECISYLPDAEFRLHLSELSLQKSYGVNFERVLLIKGSMGSEGVLFLRLHLLQCVLLYHQDKIEEAKVALRKVEKEFENLKVDENHLLQLVELGYTTEEACLALRESNGDVSIASDIIEKKRQQRKENEEIAKRERMKKRLGKCINGNWVNPEFHKILMDMGYTYKVAQWALAQSSNNISESIKLISEHPEYFPQDDSNVTNILTEQVSSLGFSKKTAKIALKKHKGDIHKALDELLVNNGKEKINFKDSSESDSDSEKSDKNYEEAYSRISEGISNYEEDYLNLNLVAESHFINKYKKLLFE